MCVCMSVIMLGGGKQVSLSLEIEFCLSNSVWDASDQVALECCSSFSGLGPSNVSHWAPVGVSKYYGSLLCLCELQ